MKLEQSCPLVWVEITQAARLWRDGDQDQPALLNALNDGVTRPGAYAELKVLNVSHAAASAVCSVLVVEIDPPGSTFFGRLGSLEERDALYRQIAEEIAVLDRAILNELRPADCGWSVVGRPCLDLGPLVGRLGVLELGEHNVVAIAASVAERAGRRLLETRAA